MTHEAQAGSRMNQILLAMLAGSLLCLVIVLIGLAIGFRLGLLAGQNLSTASSAPAQNLDQTDLQRLMSAWWDLRVRLTEIAIRVRQMEQLPHDIIAQLQSELNRATENVSESLDQKLVLIEHDISKADATTPARAAAGGRRNRAQRTDQQRTAARIAEPGGASRIGTADPRCSTQIRGQAVSGASPRRPTAGGRGVSNGAMPRHQRARYSVLRR